MSLMNFNFLFVIPWSKSWRKNEADGMFVVEHAVCIAKKEGHNWEDIIILVEGVIILVRALVILI